MKSPELRVLHVLNAASGGAALSTLGLIRELKARQVESAVACHVMGSAEERARVAQAVDGRALFLPLYWSNRKNRAPAWRRPWIESRQCARTGFGLLSATRVADFARRQGAALIHTNTSLTPEGAMAAGVLGLPHVWHVRELVGDSEPFQFRGGAPRLRRRFGAASMVIANSASTAACLAPVVAADRLQTIFNGVELEPYLGLARAEEPRGRVRIGMVGNLSSRVKRHRLFLDAAARSGLSRDRVEFSLFGHGDRADPYVDGLYRHAASLGLDVRFAGFHPEPSEIYRQLDILVHPADQESFGRVVVEAMASGIPVVGVRGGGVGELVVDGETGLLAAPDDADGLGRAIARLASDAALRERMGASARSRAVQRYSLDACVDQLVAVYRTALQRPLAPRPLFRAFQ